MNYCMFCMNPIDSTEGFCPHCGKALKTETPPHHLVPGTVLNRKFLIGVALGEGGFGITYIGRDLNLDIKVAVKEFYPSGYVNRSNTISPEVSCSLSGERKDFFDNGRERFLKEARVLAKFSGEPGVVDVRDFFEENNTGYIVMEYLDGKDLKQYLKEKGTLTPDETVKLLTPLMQSLIKIHKQDLIHRDISPDNIRLAGRGVKLMDFGAARNVSATANKSLSVMLKPGYAPEEQYRSKGNQGPWTDVYALCATMYKCITGITPDDSTQRVFSDEIKKPSELGIAIAPHVEAALMKGLSVLQKDRYQSVDELLDGLNGVVPVTASAPAAAPVNTNSDRTVYGGQNAVNTNVPPVVPNYGNASGAPIVGRPAAPNTPVTPVQPSYSTPVAPRAQPMYYQQNANNVNTASAQKDQNIKKILIAVVCVVLVIVAFTVGIFIFSNDDSGSTSTGGSGSAKKTSSVSGTNSSKTDSTSSVSSGALQLDKVVYVNETTGMSDTFTIEYSDDTVYIITEELIITPEMSGQTSFADDQCQAYKDYYENNIYPMESDFISTACSVGTQRVRITVTATELNTEEGMEEFHDADIIYDYEIGMSYSEICEVLENTGYVKQ